MKAYKKKLPRYWLGTRQPTSPGYQQSQGIGNAQFTSVQGDDVLPEARAAESNILPSGIGKTTPYMSTISAMYSTPGFYGANATKAGLAAGRAIGAIGAVAGGADIAQQYINQDSHRTAGQMLDTRSVNTYTTPGGNQYTEYGGLNTSAELRYDKANTRSKQLNNLLSWTGEGATIGSFWPGAGTLIGAGVGALIGGITNVAGFGNTETETKEAMRNVADFTAMQNRQNRSVAESQDVRDAFYARAADGLAPSFGYKDSELAGRKMSTVTNHGVDTRKVNALVSNGETIVPKEVAERGRALPGFNNGYTIPGTPNTDDKIPAHIKASDTILSGHGASQYYQETGDYYGALAMDEAHRDKISKDSMYSKMYRAKNGKLPKYDIGRLGSVALNTLPHLYSAAMQQYYLNKVRKADAYNQRKEVSFPGVSDAINMYRSTKIDPKYYLDQSRRNYNQLLYNIQRNPIYGPGGRALYSLDAFRIKNQGDYNAYENAFKFNAAQDNLAAQEKAKLGYAIGDLSNKNYYADLGIHRDALGKLWSNELNLSKGIADQFGLAASDYQKTDLQRDLIDLYYSKNQLDWEKYKAYLADQQSTVNRPENIYGWNPPQAQIHSNWKFTPPQTLPNILRS